MSAADCWRSCCCFSAQERLAWAQEHGAEVPDTLVRDAEEESTGSCSDAGENCDHCHPKNVDCARPAQKPGPVTPSPGHDRVPERGCLLVSGVMALHCQGQGFGPTAGDPGLTQVRFLEWRYDWLPAGAMTPAVFRPRLVARPPDTPPPR